MKTKICGLLILLMICLPVRIMADETDDLILSQVLRHKYPSGGYTVVSPMTTLATLTYGDSEDRAESKEYVKKTFQEQGQNVASLVEKLFEKNAKPVRLSLKSAPEDGYLIDYDGKFQKYFEAGGGGWDRWREENPQAHGFTQVSLPAYDKNTKQVLVYLGKQTNWLAGSGDLILYSYSDGEL